MVNAQADARGVLLRMRAIPPAYSDRNTEAGDQHRPPSTYSDSDS